MIDGLLLSSNVLLCVSRFFFSVIRISDLVEVLYSIISRLGFTVTAYLALLLYRYNRVLVVRA